MDILITYSFPIISDVNLGVVGQISAALTTSMKSIASTPKSNTLSLKYILKSIVDWIIVSGAASQKLRINLYAALLNFMHIVKGNSIENENVIGNDQ